ncbi:MAG: hypothetical protein WCG98_00100 [bacterium]
MKDSTKLNKDAGVEQLTALASSFNVTEKTIIAIKNSLPKAVNILAKR